ncbi:MAG: ATP-binding protein, partial [Planctomycetia bacterium]
MKRNFEATLRAWKQRADRKPLVVKGARQTGKTFVIEHFGRSDYDTVHSLNFEADPRLSTVFDGELHPEWLLRNLALLARFDPASAFAGRSLVFFDEIQLCPRALTSLKYFAEQLPGVHIAAAGSLLGVELSRAASFPVGKVELHTLHPLDFFEFLDATGRSDYRARLEEFDAIAPLPVGIHAELIATVKEYLFVGGMPEVVAAFGKERDFAGVRRIQQNIIAAYKLDFAKHAPGPIVPRLAMLWNSLAGQLARENRRFLFSAVQEGARARDYEDALLWLEQAGLVHRSFAVTTPKLPLAAYCNRRLFKLFAVDCGLLGAVANLAAEVVLRGNDVFE